MSHASDTVVLEAAISNPVTKSLAARAYPKKATYVGDSAFELPNRTCRQVAVTGFLTGRPERVGRALDRPRWGPGNSR